MQRSRLIELFQTLNKTEIKRLRKWVRSPFFSQRQDVIDLLVYLEKCKRNESGFFIKPEKLDRKYIFQKIFPNENYDEKKIGYAQSFLFQEIKKFIGYQEFSNHPFNQQILITRNLRKRGLNRHFESEWKIAKEMLYHHPLRNADFHFNNFQLQEELYEFTNSRSRKQPEGLQESADALTNYFIAHQLRQSCNMLSLKKLISADYQQNLIKESLDFVETKKQDVPPAISVYYEIHKTLSEQDGATHYQNLRGLLKTQNNIFPKTEHRTLYLAAINYCIQQHNAGKPNFTQELFELFKEGLEFQVFVENGILDRFTFKNIVTVGVNLKEFDWVENFIFQYKNKIEPAWREATFNFNLALLYYKIPDYNKAMRLLQQAEFKDAFLYLDSKKMLLKMYFELKEITALESLLESFRRYLTRHKDLGYHKELHLNLIRFVKKLLQLMPYDKSAKILLREEIEKTNALTEKNWLLDQLDLKNLSDR